MVMKRAFITALCAAAFPGCVSVNTRGRARLPALKLTADGQEILDEIEPEPHPNPTRTPPEPHPSDPPAKDDTEQEDASALLEKTQTHEDLASRDLAAPLKTQVR